MVLIIEVIHRKRCKFQTIFLISRSPITCTTGKGHGVMTMQWLSSWCISSGRRTRMPVTIHSY